ncbi:16577_t:CDS:2, partial [Dentiscutata heterogama]
TSILYEQDDDNVYMAELSRNIHEKSEKSELDNIDDYNIQDYFFSLEQINTIVQNTNKYACLKGAGERRKWTKLKVGEFKIWLAILIYSGIFKLPSIRDYWNMDNRFSEHKITTFMTMLRFEQ